MFNTGGAKREKGKFFACFFPDVVIFDDSPASDYVTIMPVSLFQHRKNSDSTEANPSPKETVTYDNITQCRERKKTKGPDASLRPSPPPLRKDRRCSVVIDIPERSLSSSSPSTKTSPRLPSKSNRTPTNCPPLPPSPKEGRRPKTPQPPDMTSSSPRETKPPPLPPRGSDSSSSSAGGAPGQSKSSSGQRSKVDASPAPRDSPPNPCDVFRELPPLPPLPPPPPPSLILDGGGKPPKVFPTGNATRFVKGVAAEERTENQMPTASPPPPSKTSSKKVSTAEELVIKQLQSRNVSQQPPVTMEILKEMKPKPKPKQTGGEAQEKKGEEMTPYEDVGQTTKRQWKRAADIPLDLDIGSLTVVELCHCLSLLKMEKYSQMFLDQMVDGALLVELSDQMLCQQFGFSVFEVKKLMNFVKNGWRPKTE